jgi:hypothetical protein
LKVVEERPKDLVGESMIVLIHFLFGQGYCSKGVANAFGRNGHLLGDVGMFGGTGPPDP